MIVDKAKVLIVEDDAVLCMLEKRMIEELGHHVVATTNNGEVALEQIKSLNPDVLISDIHLDGPLKGTEVIEKVRAEGNNIPIILLSGESDAKALEQVRSEDRISFLLKPLLIEDLKQALEKVVSCKNKVPHYDY